MVRWIDRYIFIDIYLNIGLTKEFINLYIVHLCDQTIWVKVKLLHLFEIDYFSE